MKIDTDLRLAIKAAERNQPQDTWTQRALREQASISDWMKKFPAKAKKALALREKAYKAAAIVSAAEAELCKEFGLRRAHEADNANKKFSFSHCGGNAEQFMRAGGKVHAESIKWKADSVIARLAAAEPKDAALILKGLGINWK